MVAFIDNAVAKTSAYYQMYFGHPELRAIHLRFLKNAALFATAVYVMKNHPNALNPRAP
jgi:hypothetical protein